MTTNGTQTPEQTLNEQPSTEDLMSQLTDAISSGDEDAIARLMSAEPAPVENAPPVEGMANSEANANAEVTVDPAVDPNAVEVPQPVVQEPDPLLALRSELHAMKSRVGRVDSVQSQLAELKKLVEAQAAIIAAQPKPPSKVEERLSTLKDIDPDMAETLAAMREEFSSVATPQAPVQAPDDGYNPESELERVRRVHPDVDDILVGGAKRTLWDQWKSLIPPQARALAESPYAEEYSMAYAAFKADLPVLLNMNNGQTQAPAASPVTPADNAAVLEQRERKLNAAPAVKNAPIKNESTKPFNPEEEVAKMFKEIQKRDHLI